MTPLPALDDDEGGRVIEAVPIKGLARTVQTIYSPLLGLGQIGQNNNKCIRYLLAIID